MNITSVDELPLEFYMQTDVLKIAEALIGKYIYTCFDGLLVQAIITETEAYNGIIDRASHAFGGRRTARNEMMYQEGGKAYLYLCYGIHHLFNFVTSVKDDPKAVLLRAIVPVAGIDTVLQRRRKSKMFPKIGVGPGAAAQALGLKTSMNGFELFKNHSFAITKSPYDYQSLQIETHPRVGVGYAGDDAKLPYRFVWNNPKL